VWEKFPIYKANPIAVAAAAVARWSWLKTQCQLYRLHTARNYGNKLWLKATGFSEEVHLNTKRCCQPLYRQDVLVAWRRIWPTVGSGHYQVESTYNIKMVVLFIANYRCGNSPQDRTIEECEFDFREANSWFSSPQRKDRLWVPPSILYNGHNELFLPGVKRLWIRMHRAVLHSTIKVLNGSGGTLTQWFSIVGPQSHRGWESLHSAQCFLRSCQLLSISWNPTVRYRVHNSQRDNVYILRVLCADITSHPTTLYSLKVSGHHSSTSVYLENKTYRTLVSVCPRLRVKTYSVGPNR
jgi:hypothetical protein